MLKTAAVHESGCDACVLEAMRGFAEMSNLENAGTPVSTWTRSWCWRLAGTKAAGAVRADSAKAWSKDTQRS